jgi:iron(III) transport system substrate-binding protein
LIYLPPGHWGNRRLSGTKAALLLLWGISACSGDGRTPVTVYSPHGRDQLMLLERAFEAKNPDIDIRWLDMGSQEILDRIRFEKVNPQCDVWFGGPTTIFDRGVAESLITAFRPSWADHVDPRGVGPNDLYWPVYRTPAVIAFNSTAVTPDIAPHDWDDVLAPRWRDKVLIRDPVASGTMRAIWGLIIQKGMATPGDTAPGMDWLRRLDGQTKSYTLNPAVLEEKLSRQEGLVTLWDLPDILIAQDHGLPFGYTFPRSGTVVIDDAIALVRGSRHADAARRFINYVGESDAQLLTARKVFRLPARLDLPMDSVPSWVQEVENAMVIADVDWAMLAREGATWMGYWDQHVRGTGKDRRASESTHPPR